jgi:hypothetical protein
MASLEQDYTSVPGQLYALISLVGPDMPQKNDKFGLKIRGCFSSHEEASSYAKRLQREDATFDIYVVDMYKWLLIPPDRDQIENVHYAEEKLEEIMTKYKENQTQAKILFEKRKKDMIEKTTYLDPSDENSKYYTRPDEPPISHPADVVERLRKENPDKSVEQLVKEANEIIEQEMKERQEWRLKNSSAEPQDSSPSLEAAQ